MSESVRSSSQLATHGSLFYDGALIFNDLSKTQKNGVFQKVGPPGMRHQSKSCTLPSLQWKAASVQTKLIYLKKFPYPNKTIESLFICPAIIITEPESSQRISRENFRFADSSRMVYDREKRPIFSHSWLQKRLTLHSWMIDSISFHRINLLHPEEEVRLRRQYFFFFFNFAEPIHIFTIEPVSASDSLIVSNSFLGKILICHIRSRQPLNK